MNITLRILFRPRPDSLPNIYTTLGVDYDDRVLPSITNEVIHDYFSVRMRSIYSGGKTYYLPTDTLPVVKYELFDRC